MSIIGDLFFSLRGDGKQLEVDVKKAGDQAGTSFGARMAASLKKSWSGGEIGKGLVQGLGLAGGLGAARLFSSAISTVTDVLGDATQAALAEEVSIQKLGTSLRANIPAWNGQTDAIESVLKARMKLGFSDDEQRESLALLVVATKDANKALAVQRVAMDLSRLKGISLKEASEALIKVEAGQFRALKALGIQLPKNATATEALAAVTKVAAGQAEDYAETNSGKLLVSQVKMGEAMERLGELTMPAFVEVMNGAADAIENFILGVDELRRLLGPTANALEEFETWTSEIADSFTPWDRESETAAKAVAKNIEDMRESTRGSVGRANDDLGTVEVALNDVGDASGDLAKDVKDDVKVISTSWEEMKDDVVDTARDLIDKALAPVEARDRLVATNAEISAARRVLASKTATDAEIRDAEVTLHETTKDTAESLLTLARAGLTGSQVYQTGVANLKESIRTATGPVKTYLQGVLALIHQVEREGKSVPINIKVNRSGNIGITQPRAEGGPVWAGMPYIVGERRAELFVPKVNGTILPSVPSMTRGSTPLGGTTVWQVTNNGMPLTAETPAAFVSDLRRAVRIGSVKPPQSPTGWAP